MFIINLNYIAPVEQIDAHMPAHMRFLKKYYGNNTFVMSGRKVPRTGGIIIAKARTREETEKIMNEDPFIANKLAEFSIVEFQTSQYHPDLKKMLQG